jgi:hypothetical protein
MTDPVVKNPTVEKPTSKPKRKKAIISTKNIKTAAPFVRAGLALAGRVKKIRPYTQLLDAVIGLGAEALPDEQKELLLKLRALRNQIKESEKDTTPSYYRAQMDMIIDTLLEKSGI